jgi:hypothetical protein
MSANPVYLPRLSARRRDRVSTDEPVQLRPLVDELTTVPAVVFNSLFDVLCYNKSFDCLFQQSIQPNDIRANIIWRLFLDQSFRKLWYNWENVAKRATAKLRSMKGFHTQPERYQALIEALSESADFSTIWSSCKVYERIPRCGVLEIETPSLGKATFQPSTMVQSDNPGLLFVALMPTDQVCRQRVAVLRRRATGGAEPITLGR